MNESLPSVSQAEATIAAKLIRYSPEDLALDRALGGVLAEQLLAERDQPPFDRVTMDGIAIPYQAFADGTRCFPIQGIQAAGAPPMTLDGAHSCIEAMTGAVLPTGCDTVIPVERILIKDGMARLEDNYRPDPGQFVHPQGSDYRQGSELLAPGTRVGLPQIALLAANGKARVKVAGSPHIAIVSTGDEVVEVDQPVLAHQIRQSNSHAIRAALSAAGHTHLTTLHLQDNPDSLREQLRGVLEHNQVVILSGGVSRGKFDFVPGALGQLGVEKHIHRVAQRPGKPMWFGTLGDQHMVFALPGNPVSSLVCLHRYVLPALAAGLGCAPPKPPRLALAEPVTCNGSLAYFLPVSVTSDKQACWLATPRMTNTSGDFSSLNGTDGFVELPAGQEVFPAGYVADFYPWSGQAPLAG